MGSPLDFISSEGFRKKLITRNLSPYQKAPNRPTPQINYEYLQSDTSVLDSPDSLIDEPSFANRLFPLNQYGNEGGYKQVPDPGNLLNSKSNEGEYGFQDANLLDQSIPESQKWKPLNKFSNGAILSLDSAPFFESLNLLPSLSSFGPNNQPYPTFVASFYNPASILLSKDPVGSDGLLSKDSFIARLGADTLRKEFEERIATQIRQQTIGRINAFNVRGGTDILSLATGRVPLIEPNYTITSPSNPIIAATDFALRLAGSTIPTSTIPGSYWDTNINTKQPTTIQQLTNAFKKTSVGKAFSSVLGSQTGSQLFLNNTGGGQKSRLFLNIDYNKYKPNYDRTIFDRLAGALVGTTTNNSNYYVGSKNSDPSRIFSPGGDIPVDSYGREVQSPVYGPQELAQLYEGPSQDVKLGANGPTYSNGGGIEGGFTWVSPKYKGNAGKKVGIGGLIGDQDENFRPSSYNSTESTNREFRDGSILDQTQRIIDSQPQGGRRLQHVGNAIDQVSKVFNDGYKELTKGSRVLSYIGGIGQEVGSEYCRVFAKDTPYLEYSDLQKTDGMTTEGRKFAWSVMDKTYNLNIYPNKQEGGQDSTNLIGTNDVSFAKKYMFSLENLAWRTSSTPGYTVSDLPVCEKGPNGGRVMWFPPYGLTFTEGSTASWKDTNFIGRPEPVYTYSNTNRTGSISFKIVVDHPSVLNLIVNNVLKNETNKTRIDSIIDSFFAGCRKYDLYELAKKYYTISKNDLYELQQAITSKDSTKEQLKFIANTLQTGNNTPNGTDTPVSPNTTTNPFEKYNDYAFYFDNDMPKTNGGSYSTQYTEYIGKQSFYSTNAPEVTVPYQSNSSAVNTFFPEVIKYNFEELSKMRTEMSQFLIDNKTTPINIILNGSASAPASVEYNKQLSERRNYSVMEWFLSDPVISKAYAESRFKIAPPNNLGESTTVTTIQYGKISGSPYGCTDKDSLAPSKQIYTVNAMACRRVAITVIVPKNQEPQKPPQPSTQKQPDGLTSSNQVVPIKSQQLEQKEVERDNITKRVLRKLLSECDYFEAIKENTPAVYDSLKEKLKFFQPAFHSMTPEGLNSRLTFLQQCMRPGDTIPTVKQKTADSKPTLEYNNAVNTAFGSPPVLILRVGDFYNTKIIPTNLSLTYEDLDINPEGIGIQPMIANVTLSFNFIGGNGLKQSVDKIQNALTFNYYANTEIYDDRADVTDDSYKVLDRNFMDSIKNQVSGPTVNQVQNNNGQSNNEFIGTVITTSGDSGTITYKGFMDKFVEESQNYFTNIINKNKEVVKQYNNAMRQYWTCDRNYIDGKILVGSNNDDRYTPLVGKPANMESKINEVFSDFISDIQSNNKNTQDRFINYLDTKNINNKILRQVERNYTNFVSNKKGSYQNAVTKIIQELSISQQNYIQYLSRANTILHIETSDNGTDGLQTKNGEVKIINISGTTAVNSSSNGASNTFQELQNDIKTIQTSLFNFYKDIISNETISYKNSTYNSNFIFGDSANSTNYIKIKKQVFYPFSTEKEFDYLSFRRSYMILSDEILDDKKYQTFKTAIIGNIINNSSLNTSGNIDLSKEFDTYWLLVAKPFFQKETEITNLFLDKVEKNTLKNFVKFTPFGTKDRLFSYSVSQTPSNEQKVLIKSLGAIDNSNKNVKTWNTYDYVDTYISKVKLN